MYEKKAQEKPSEYQSRAKIVSSIFGRLMSVEDEQDVLQLTRQESKLMLELAQHGIKNVDVALKTYRSRGVDKNKMYIDKCIETKLMLEDLAVKLKRIK